METSKLSILLLLATIATLSVLPSSSSFPSGAGQWKLLKRNLGISAMHMALLPNGNLVAFDRTEAGPSNISLPLPRCLDSSESFSAPDDCTSHSVLFNPSNRSVRPLTLLTDTWCSSGALSSNGTLIQTGGYNAGDKVVRYLALDSDWVEDPTGLAARRWYATNQILPDGRIVIVGGRFQFNYEFVPKPASDVGEVFELPFLKETRDGNAENNLYPFVHLSPDGNLFIFANTKAILLDYVNHMVVRLFPAIPGEAARNYPSAGSSVLLPIQLDSAGSAGSAEVMICGGAAKDSHSLATQGVFAPAASSCGRLVITDESPEWKMMEMPVRRVMGDMISLPTGDVLIINGAANGTAGWGLAREAVTAPVLYDWKDSTFKVMASSPIARVYHSAAHLIADGRVLVGGSNTHVRYEFGSDVLFPTELSLEAFLPPYLGVPRPRILAVAKEVGYGERVRVGFGLKGEVGEDRVEVTMVAPSFTTHSISMNQRVLVLKVEGVRDVESGYEAEVVAPASGVVAPSGYYLFFVVHEGVPSRGEWVQIK